MYIMATLKELYNALDTLRKMNLPVDDKLLAAADELEEKIIKEDILPALSQIIEPQLKEIQRDLVLVVEHHPGEPLRVALSRTANHSEIIREMLNAKPLTSTTDTPVPTSHTPIEDSTPDTLSAISQNDEGTQERYKNPSKGLRVTFPDGTIICKKKAIDTYIDTLQKIGFEKVASLDLECRGYNIVSRTQRPPTPKCTWQHKIGDWYIYSNISNQAKASFLQQISDSLRLSLKIELLTEEK